MKAVYMTAAEVETLTAMNVRHVAGGPTDLPALLIRRAKALIERTGQAQAHVYAGHACVLTVSRREGGFAVVAGEELTAARGAWIAEDLRRKALRAAQEKGGGS